jgi:RNA polymerase sigma-70 factor (ECF subfamily)
MKAAPSAQYGRRGRASQLRQARRLPLGAHARRAAAEDALSEAFASALTDWPRNGCPSNPEAWLLLVARRKLIDLGRRQRSGEIVAEDLRVLAEGLDAASAEADTAIPDQRLALMFACAHPAIDPGIRSPLILQVVLGLDAASIASAFLMSPAAMGKRLVRAKDKIRQAGVPFRTGSRGTRRSPR